MTLGDYARIVQKEREACQAVDRLRIVYNVHERAGKDLSPAHKKGTQIVIKLRTLGSNLFISAVMS